MSAVLAHSISAYDYDHSLVVHLPNDLFNDPLSLLDHALHIVTVTVLALLPRVVDVTQLAKKERKLIQGETVEQRLTRLKIETIWQGKGVRGFHEETPRGGEFTVGKGR
jgi:hypothetical protein